MRNKSVIFAGILLFTIGGAAPAYAGKPERDKAEELKPTLTETKDGMKAACGCDIAVEVKWDSYATVNDMGAIYGALGTLKSNMISHCATEADKKAICENVMGAEIVFGSDAAVKYSAKKISISTNEAYAGDSAYSEILDKF